MKKKKNTPYSSRKHAFQLLVLICMMLSMCSLIFLFLMSGIPSNWSAHYELQAMKNWDIPSDSRVVGFTTFDTAGGNTCFVVGRLTIESDLPESKLTHFYNSRYDSKWYGGPYGIEAKAIKNGSVHTNVYYIDAVKIWKC